MYLIMKYTITKLKGYNIPNSMYSIQMLTFLKNDATISYISSYEYIKKLLHLLSLQEVVGTPPPIPHGNVRPRNNL